MSLLNVRPTEVSGVEMLNVYGNVVLIGIFTVHYVLKTCIKYLKLLLSNWLVGYTVMWYSGPPDIISSEERMIFCGKPVPVMAFKGAYV